MKCLPRYLCLPAFAAWAAIAFLVGGCGSAELANFPPQNEEICCFGDSLVEGVGAPDDQSYPAHLARLTGRRVTSWGISGETTTDALDRLDKFADGQFGIVIVTLGGNDILKRSHWDETEQNLYTIFRRLKETGAVVVFTGVTGPLNPTRGGEYKRICREEGVLYVPEILDGLMGNDDLMADEIHPNAKGYRKLAERLVDELRDAELLE